MSRGWSKTGWVGLPLAVLALVCAPSLWAQGPSAPNQHSSSHPAAAPHATAARPQSQPHPTQTRPQNQSRPSGLGAAPGRTPNQTRPATAYNPAGGRTGQVYSGQGNAQIRQTNPAIQQNAPRGTVRPALPNASVQASPAYPGPPYLGQGYSRPTVQGYKPPVDAPSGHLGSWLEQHRNLPVAEQERQLRADPSFNRLSPGTQQRLVQQLHQVNELTPDQQQRRAARVEMLEKLTPQERMQVNLSQKRWANLPRDRQVLVKKAFHDLGSVPPDQRQTVLNSRNYQGVFSPEERGILSDLLRVEPYRPPGQ